MLDSKIIHDRICHLKKHGDNACDIRELAMLYVVLDHMEESDKHEANRKLTREQAIEWVNSMRGEDPAVPHGGKWTMEQVKPIAVKYGVQPETDDFVELWAVMNAMYNDYFSIAKKYNAMTPDFFADMAMAFIHDKDAVKNKVHKYYECIVEK